MVTNPIYEGPIYETIHSDKHPPRSLPQQPNSGGSCCNKDGSSCNTGTLGPNSHAHKNVDTPVCAGIMNEYDIPATLACEDPYSTLVVEDTYTVMNSVSLCHTQLPTQLLDTSLTRTSSEASTTGTMSIQFGRTSVFPNDNTRHVESDDN